MRKIMIFQHVAHELLGTLNPMLKDAGFRIRYINFERHPELVPKLETYNGLVILGGPMGVYEADRYTHLKAEMKLIEEALKKKIPILGICLGAQLIAHVLGSHVRKSKEKEIGWYSLELTKDGSKDPLFQQYSKTEKVFQLHGDMFDPPPQTVHLARTKACEGQAFRYGENVYGLQFHLEVDARMIHRWLHIPANQKEIEESKGQFSKEKIEIETAQYITRSLELSHSTFSKFIELFGFQKSLVLGSGHGKPKRPL